MYEYTAGELRKKKYDQLMAALSGSSASMTVSEYFKKYGINPNIASNIYASTAPDIRERFGEARARLGQHALASGFTDTALTMPGIAKIGGKEASTLAELLAKAKTEEARMKMSVLPYLEQREEKKKADLWRAFEWSEGQKRYDEAKREREQARLSAREELYPARKAREKELKEQFKRQMQLAGYTYGSYCAKEGWIGRGKDSRWGCIDKRTGWHKTGGGGKGGSVKIGGDTRSPTRKKWDKEDLMKLESDLRTKEYGEMKKIEDYSLSDQLSAAKGAAEKAFARAESYK